MPDRAYISKITLPSGSTYYLKDEEVRELISDIEKYTKYLGVTTTALTDGATTNPIMINGESVTAESGNIATYNSKEFIFNGTAWQEFGDLSGLGALAYKNSASGSYTPAGSVSQPTFTGTSKTVTVTGTAAGSVAITTADNTDGNYQPKGTVSKPSFTGASMTSTGKFTPAGTIDLTKRDYLWYHIQEGTTYDPTQPNTQIQPKGTVSAPTISVKTAGTTTKVNSITNVGTLPVLTTTVSDETLTINFSQGTLPTKGSDTTVKTGDAAYQASAPTFTGTQVFLYARAEDVVTGADFEGTEGNLSVTGTTTGSVSQPTFSGTKVQINGTFAGETVTSTGSFKPEGTVSKPTFTGTQGTVTVS